MADPPRAIPPKQGLERFPFLCSEPLALARAVSTASMPSPNRLNRQTKPGNALAPKRWGVGLHRTGEDAHVRGATSIARDRPSLSPGDAALGPRRGGPAGARHARCRQVRRPKHFRLGFDPQRRRKEGGLALNGCVRFAVFRLAHAVAPSDVRRSGLLGDDCSSSEADRRPQDESAEEHQWPKCRPSPHGGDYRTASGGGNALWPSPWPGRRVRNEGSGPARDGDRSSSLWCPDRYPLS